MKPNTNLTLADHRLLDLVWQAEPVSSPQLCKLAEEALGWKRTTTYTVIKRLCGKGCLKNENAIVISLVDRATVQQADGQEVLQRSFNGSLPNFLAAFLRAGSVSDQEAAQLEELRAAMPHTFFLVPGYGAQGGTAEDVQYAFDKYGHGAIVNSSRGIMCAWQKEGVDGQEYAAAAHREAIRMRDEIVGRIGRIVLP